MQFVLYNFICFHVLSFIPSKMFLSRILYTFKKKKFCCSTAYFFFFYCKCFSNLNKNILLILISFVIINKNILCTKRKIVYKYLSRKSPRLILIVPQMSNMHICFYYNIHYYQDKLTPLTLLINWLLLLGVNADKIQFHIISIIITIIIPTV